MAKKTKGAPAPKQHFRAWRKYRGYTLEQAAEIIGTTHATLSRWEKDKTPYSQPILEAMAEAYRCAPADLIMRDPAQPGGIWSIWDQIPPAQREQAAKVLEAFTKKTGTAG